MNQPLIEALKRFACQAETDQDIVCIRKSATKLADLLSPKPIVKPNPDRIRTLVQKYEQLRSTLKD